MVFSDHICARSIDEVMKHLVLVAEDVVVDVEHLRRLSSQDERLHEATHRTHVVGQLSGHLLTTITVKWSASYGNTQTSARAEILRPMPGLAHCLLGKVRLL